MRWRGRQQSSNVDDRRGGGGIPKRGRQIGGGIGLVGIVAAVVIYLMGGDPSAVLNSSSGTGQVTERSAQPRKTSKQEDELAAFVSVVLQDTEDAWNMVFRKQLGRSYREPIMVLYSDEVQSACGYSTSATGPFYCPADQKLYIDLSFYNELKTKFRASGDFAMAYVVAHEVGHHVQNLLGDSRRVSSQRGRISKAEYNKLSVRLELQADFYAGLWAHHAQKMKNILENGDLEEALRAAKAIGDDNLQKRSRGYVVPESFTHGTSAQRMRWFKKGFESGKVKDGDTFSARRL